MSLAYEIIPARLSDLFAVHALERACFGRDAWGLLDLSFALIGSMVRLKAISGGRLAGFVVGDPHPTQGFAWISTIGVHPDFQRRGIGAALLTAAEAGLTTPIVKLTVRKSNAPAITLYEKFGYKPVTVWDHYYANGEAGIVMEKARAGYKLPHGLNTNEHEGEGGGQVVAGRRMLEAYSWRDALESLQVP